MVIQSLVPVVRVSVGVVTVAPALRTRILGFTVQTAEVEECTAIASTVTPLEVAADPRFAAARLPVWNPEISTMRGASLIVVVPMIGAVSVLLVSVSVVAFPSRVSVAAGSVSVPDAVAVAFKVVVPEVEPLNTKPVPDTVDALVPQLHVSVLWV